MNNHAVLASLQFRLVQEENLSIEDHAAIQIISLKEVWAPCGYDNARLIKLFSNK